MGGSLQDPPGELTVTADSRMSASILLSKLFDDLKCDAERENFHRLCENYIRCRTHSHQAKLVSGCGACRVVGSPERSPVGPHFFQPPLQEQGWCGCPFLPAWP